MSENSQDYAQKPQQNCTFLNSASGLEHSARGWPVRKNHPVSKQQAGVLFWILFRFQEPAQGQQSMENPQG